MASAASEAAVAAATAACSANLFRSEHGVVPNEEEKENDSDSNRNKAEIIWKKYLIYFVKKLNF